MPEPKKFGLIAEWWQRERNERVIPAAEFVGGLNPTYDGKMFFWECWPKGSDKSNTIARIADWLLAYAKRPLRMFAAAKDAEQARVVYDAMQRTADLNPWLKKHLEFHRNVVTGKTNGSRLQVLTSDAGGVAGITPEVLICDELAAWSDHLFWDGLFGGAMKRSGIDPATGKPKGHCLTYVISNSGYLGTWQAALREEARNSPLWSFYESPPYKTMASWLSPEVIAAVRRGMTEWEAKRLLDNVWCDPAEAGIRYFHPDDIDSAVGIPKDPPPGAIPYLGVDYGERKDRTALAVVWLDTDTGIVHVPEVTVWQGRPDQPVQLEEVEHWVDLQLGRYPNAIPVFDPHQTLYLIQKYEKQGQPVRKFDFRSGKGNLLMATNLRNLFRDRKIVFSLYTGLIGGSTLVDEFKQIIGQEKSYGVRMQHERNQHDDRVCAVAIAAYCAVCESVPGPVPQKSKPVVEDHSEDNSARPSNSWDRSHAARRGLFGIQPSY